MATELDFDELNKLTEYSMNSNKSYEEFINDVESLLILAYISGIDLGNDDLGTSYESVPEELNNSLNRDIAGKSYKDRIEEYYREEDGFTKIKRVVATEAHRMLNEGTEYVGKRATADGMTVFKTWSTVGDEKVRDTHSYLQGMTVPIKDKFFTFDGDSAYCCGGFSNAENNINCRCSVHLSS